MRMLERDEQERPNDEEHGNELVDLDSAIRAEEIVDGWPHEDSLSVAHRGAASAAGDSAE